METKAGETEMAEAKGRRKETGRRSKARKEGRKEEEKIQDDRGKESSRRMENLG